VAPFELHQPWYAPFNIGQSIDRSLARRASRQSRVAFVVTLQKKGEEMRRSQPQWIIKKHLPELSTMRQLMTGQNDTVLHLK
jgi:hypothetical protein